MRKRNGLTQMNLAEKLNITDRAVSKWENGKALPDSSIMLELCSVLRISVNDLLNGEVVKMDNYNEKLEKNLIEIMKQKEEADRRLLSIEIFLASVLTLLLLVVVCGVSYFEIENKLRILLISIAVIIFVIGMTYCLKIEQVAGYYKCSKCNHTYVPTFKSVFLSAHINRTRYMKCERCSERCWHKKVLRKEENL